MCVFALLRLLLRLGLVALRAEDGGLRTGRVLEGAIRERTPWRRERRRANVTEWKGRWAFVDG